MLRSVQQTLSRPKATSWAMAAMSDTIRANKWIGKDHENNWKKPQLPVVPRALPMTDAVLESNGEAVRVNFADGAGSAVFHNLWLRDHCPCPSCTHPRAAQRLTNILDFPEVPEIASLKGWVDADNPSDPRLFVEWSDKHLSEFPSSFLFQNSYAPALAAPAPRPRLLWGGEIMHDPPKFHLEKDGLLTTDEGLYAAVRAIDTAGFVLIEGLEPTPESTQQTLEAIGHIRETFYGGLYDFRPNGERGDTAYSSLALKVHTDGSYFTIAPGLQSFHALEFEGTGGESHLTDGFRAAEALRVSDPESFKVLTETVVPSRYQDTDERYLAARPWIELDPQGRIFRVTLNNDDRHILNLPPDVTSKWYRAVRAFSREVYNKTNQFTFSLAPGTLVIFDNWRVLHGRSSFTGNRRICGAYQTRDAFDSRMRLLEERLQKKNGMPFRSWT